MRRRFRLAILFSAFLASIVTAGCRAGTGPASVAVGNAIDLDVEPVARQSARRLAAVDELARASRSGPESRRRLALRALGRVGGEQSVAQLSAELAQRDPATAVAALEALGLTGVKEAAPLLVPFVASEEVAWRRAAVWSLGRVGGADQLPVLEEALGDDDPSVRAAAGIALGLFGRRSIALPESGREKARALFVDPEPRVRYGAAYALAFMAPTLDDVSRDALARRVEGEEQAETRAMIVAALFRGEIKTSIFLRALYDRDWRVRAAGVNGLVAGLDTDPMFMSALTATLSREWERYREAGFRGGSVHPMMQLLWRLLERESGVPDLAPVSALRKDAAIALTRNKTLGPGWVHCLSTAILVRGKKEELAALRRCGGDEFPKRLRLQIEIALIHHGGTAAFGGRNGAQKRLLNLLESEDEVVASRALGAALAGTDSTDEFLRLVSSAIRSDSAPVAGTALEELVKRSERLGEAGPVLARALATRAEGEEDLELLISILTALQALAEADSEPVCRKHHRHWNRSVRAAARHCLTVVAGKDPGAGVPEAPPPEPPVELARAAGRRFVWKVETSAGEVTLELDGQLAPWHVSAILENTRSGLYNGTLFHRVVPGFVVQGGDPKGSGWGGPGYTLPAEPSSEPYVTGIIGIADAGLDTGGSQWFAMHAPAPHLEGRYSVVGRVISGQEVLDSLVEGDRILSAIIEAR